MARDDAAAVGDGLRPIAAGRLDAAGRDEVARAEAVLHELLDAVGPRLLAAAGAVEVEAKSDGTPVTREDRETDQRLVAGLTGALAGHGAVSEETSQVVPSTDWTWVLDPIDGTSNFIAGLPFWCVSVALCHEGSPVLGVVDAPALGLRAVATAGGGARDAGGPLHVGRTVDPTDRRSAHVPALYSGGAARRMVAGGAVRNARRLGSPARDLVMVARGAAPLAVTLAPHAWDVAAGALLVLEAGGACAAFGTTPLLPLGPGTDLTDRVDATVAAADADLAARAVAIARG
ncbi:MAG: inositol monophosphatase family protein [Nitriliruptoraceae bacterium]